MAKKSILGEFMATDINKMAFDNQIENIHYTKIKRPIKNRQMRRIEELAEDIREDGLENNLLVRRIEDDQFDVELIGGERRFTAILLNIEKYKDLTYEYIPCKITTMSELDARRRLILNNHENDPLTAGEKIAAVEELKEIYQAKKSAGEKIPGRIQTLIAQEMGLGKSQIANFQKLSNHASPKVREKLDTDKITIDAALELVDLDEKKQNEFIDNYEEYNKKAVKEFKANSAGDQNEQDNEKKSTSVDNDPNIKKDLAILDNIISNTDFMLELEGALSQTQKIANKELHNCCKSYLNEMVAGWKHLSKLKNEWKNKEEKNTW